MNWYDFTSSRGLSDFNVGRRLVTSLLYELPFGHGQSLGGKWSGLLDKIGGGWQVGSILTPADGTPMNVGGIGETTNTEEGTLPDATGISPFPSNRTAQAFWNIAAFNGSNPQLSYRFLMRRQSSGSTASGTARECAISTKPP